MVRVLLGGAAMAGWGGAGHEMRHEAAEDVSLIDGFADGAGRAGLTAQGGR